MFTAYDRDEVVGEWESFESAKTMILESASDAEFGMAIRLMEEDDCVFSFVEMRRHRFEDHMSYVIHVTNHYTLKVEVYRVLFYPEEGLTFIKKSDFS